MTSATLYGTLLKDINSFIACFNGYTQQQLCAIMYSSEVITDNDFSNKQHKNP